MRPEPQVQPSDEATANSDAVTPATNGPTRPPTSGIDAASATPDTSIDVPELLTKERLSVGVISGYGYRNLKGGMDRLTGFLRGVPNVSHHSVRTPSEVAAAVDGFTAAGIDIVAVSGGDGTVSMVATHLMRNLETTRPPVLALLEGGRTNMTAGDIGVRGAGNQLRRLRDLLTWAETAERSQRSLAQRPLIGVDSDCGALHCGFFVGGGAIYQGSLETWKFRDGSRVPGMRTGLGTATSVVKMIASHLISRSAFPATQMRILVDGEPLPEEQWCVLMITTLDRMALGIRPFWDKTPKPIRLTAVAHDHRKLLRSAFGGLRGRPGRHLTPANGFYSVNAHEVDLRLDGGVTLDGEVVQAQLDRIRLSIAGSLTFLR